MVIKEKTTLIFSIIKSIAILLLDAMLINLAVILKDGFFVLLASVLSGCICIAFILFLLAPAILKPSAVDGECILQRGSEAHIAFGIRRGPRFLYGKIAATCIINDAENEKRVCITLPFSSRVSFPCKYVGSWRIKTVSYYLWDPFGIFVRRVRIKNDKCKHICVLPLERNSLYTAVKMNKRFDNMFRYGYKSLEMDGVRPYNSGDPIVQIAWKTVARTRKLYVKNMVDANNSTVSIAYLYHNDPSYVTVATELILCLCKHAFENGNDTIKICSGNEAVIFNKGESAKLATYLACANAHTDLSLFEDIGIVVAPFNYEESALSKTEIDNMILIGEGSNERFIVINGLDRWVDSYE